MFCDGLLLVILMFGLMFVGLVRCVWWLLVLIGWLSRVCGCGMLSLVGFSCVVLCVILIGGCVSICMLMLLLRRLWVVLG